MNVSKHEFEFLKQDNVAAREMLQHYKKLSEELQEKVDMYEEIENVMYINIIPHNELFRLYRDIQCLKERADMYGGKKDNQQALDSLASMMDGITDYYTEKEERIQKYDLRKHLRENGKEIHEDLLNDREKALSKVGTSVPYHYE